MYTNRAFVNYRRAPSEVHPTTTAVAAPTKKKHKRKNKGSAKKDTTTCNTSTVTTTITTTSMISAASQSVYSTHGDHTQDSVTQAQGGPYKPTVVSSVKTTSSPVVAVAAKTSQQTQTQSPSPQPEKPSSPMDTTPADLPVLDMYSLPPPSWTSSTNIGTAPTGPPPPQPQTASSSNHTIIWPGKCAANCYNTFH